jgi:hypothetical protein
VLALVLSAALWLSIFVVPWLPLEADRKWLLAACLYGGSYAVFFAASALLGREVLDAMKARARGWLRRR